MDRIKNLFKNLPIQRKVSLAILLTCGTALAVTALAIFLAQLITFRQTFTRDLEAIGAIIGNNSTAAVTFQDPKAASEILGALKAKPHILQAAIVLPNGIELAAYRSPKRAVGPAAPKVDGFHFAGPYLVLNQPIILARERIGTLRLVSDYQAEYHRSFSLYAGILATVLLVSILLALLLSDRLQRLISTPILGLASTAQRVAELKDYTLRAKKLARDEVGQLTDAFNAMLTKIENHDAALRESNQALEREVEERKKTQDALQTSERFMHSLVESLPQNILRKDLAGRFTFANGLFCRTTGKTLDQLIGKTDHDLFPAERAAKYRQDDKEVIASGKLFETVEENQNLAGEKIFVQVIKTPLQDADNHPIGLQVIFWDVTARKQAEEALEKLNKQLVLTSRQAGMAEVATGVLHNVGNVLNSVNVSLTLIRDQLRQSEIASLTKLAGLLQTHAADSAAFLTEHPKGKLIPGFIIQLAEQLGQEHLRLQQEHNLLVRNVEHIKEIVAMQQNYASVSGIRESVSMADLVDDALQMHTAGLQRHGVNVQREFSEVPPLTVDKHKVLQILVNLIHNAKYALDASGRSDRQLTVGISANGDQRVKVTVADNGIGIPPENLTRIFSLGFTTRKGGHGFGLHSGANAAKEMGGILRAQSQGPGKGATFTLELPMVHERAKL